MISSNFKSRFLLLLNQDGNDIKVLSSEIFQNTSNLKELMIFINRIETIPDGLFQHVPKLENLNIGNEKLENYLNVYLVIR